MSSESYFKVPKEQDFLKIIEDAEEAGVLDKAATAVNNPLSWLRFIPSIGVGIRQAEKEAEAQGKQNPLFEKGFKETDEERDLAKELGRPITSADDLAGALQELQSRGIDLASALELTDKRSVSAFNTFVQGAGDLVELRDSITDVNEELEDMAEKRLDTIAGQFTLLESAFSEFVLSVNEGSGVGNTLKGFLSFLANNLPQIVKVVSRLALGYGALVVSQKASVLWTRLQSVNFKTLGKDLIGVITGTKKLSESQMAGSKSAKAFGRALKTIGFAVAIELLIEITKQIYDFASGTAKARSEMETLNDELERSERFAKEDIQRISEKSDKLLKELEIRKSLGKVTEEQFLAEKKQIIENEKLKSL